MDIPAESLPRMTPEEYLAYEHSQQTRHELVDGYLYAMTGASRRHEEIAVNLLAALHAHLRGTPCRAYKGDLKVRQGDDFFYPDVFVSCGDDGDGDRYFENEPVLIAEVLSPSTQRHDRGDKRPAYWRLPSLREYVLIWQDGMRVELTRRDEDTVTVLDAPGDVLALGSVEFEMTLERLYE